MRLIGKFRHIILFAVLIAQDLVIGFIGYYQGSNSGEDMLTYLNTVTATDFAPVLVVSVCLVILVEFLWRGH